VEESSNTFGEAATTCTYIAATLLSLARSPYKGP